MIRDVPMGARFTFDRMGSGTRRVGRVGRMGDASIALSFNPITAGIGAATSLATSAIQGWMNSIQLSHDADTATTLIVNGLAAQLQNLLNAYMSEANVSCASQRAALDAYDQAWAWLQSAQACGNPNYGSAGNRCISDRAPGGQYPWQTYYRDPIANDPRLANAGCDTGQDVILPTVTTDSYADTGITSTGGSSTTGQTAAQIAAAALAAAAATGTPASTAPPTATGPTSTTTVAGVAIPTPYIWIGVGLIAAAFLAREL